MSGTFDPIADVLTALGIAPAALGNDGGLGSGPLATMTESLGGPAPPAPVIAAPAPAVPATSSIGAAVAPLATTPPPGLAPGGEDIQALVAPQAATNPLAAAVAGIGHHGGLGGGLGGGLK